jgi:hypothetical protein
MWILLLLLFLGFGQKGQLVIGMSEDWFMVSNTKAHNPTTNSVD